MVYSNIELFKNISEKDLKELLVCCGAKTKEYSKGEYVWLAGDPAQHVGIVITGQVNIIKEDILGNRNIIGKVSEGNVFGETVSCAGIESYPVSVEVVTQSKIMLLFLSRVLQQCPQACAYHTQLIKNLLEIIAEKNLVLNQKISYLNKKTTRQKIAYLLISHMKHEDDTSIVIDFSREEMADYLGINRSALSRELGWLSNSGIIDYKKNRFTILNLKALAQSIDA